MEALQYIIANYKELGASGTAGVLIILFSYNKFIEKKLLKIGEDIKSEANQDYKKFKKVEQLLTTNKLLIDQVVRDLEQCNRDYIEQKKQVDSMIIGLETQSNQLIANSHKIELTDKSVNTLKFILTDAIKDIKDIQKNGQSLEVAFAKILGTLSRGTD